MKEPNIHDAMKAISKMIQQDETAPEDIRADFAIADAMHDAKEAFFSISKAVSCNHDLPLLIKKAWLAHRLSQRRTEFTSPRRNPDA